MPLKSPTSAPAATSSIAAATQPKMATMVANNKTAVPQQHVAAPLIGGKPVMQRQNSQPLVIGQLGELCIFMFMMLFITLCQK